MSTDPLGIRCRGKDMRGHPCDSQAEYLIALPVSPSVHLALCHEHMVSVHQRTADALAKEAT